MFLRLKFPILILSMLLLAGCSIPGLPQKKAGLQVNVMHDERVSVYLDGMNVGQSPYKSEEVKPGSYTIRLVPEDGGKQAYETTVKLSSGLLTVMNWSFGKTIEESGGEIFELAKLSNKNKAELSLVTNPDNIIVKVDGQSKGFSPLILSDLSEGTHSLTLTAPGYIERTSNPKLVNGYRVVVTTKLAREPLLTEPSEQAPSETTETPTESSPSPSPSPKASSTPKPTPKPSSSPTATSSASTSITPDFPYVEIAQTTTGWLRVRAESSSTGEELAKLDVGAKVPYLNETVSGWHKVEYEDGKEGWVSGQYAVIHKE